MTTASLTPMEELTSLAEKLNTQSTEANEALALANEKLASRNVEVEVWLGPWEQDREPYQIGFAQVGDRWQLATRTCEACFDEENMPPDWIATPGSFGPSLPVVEGSRAIRLEAVELLPAIISQLNREIKKKLDARQDGIDAAFKL